MLLDEDNITAKSQAGASGTFVHQHVLRAVNTTWGKVLTWENNKSTYTYTFSLNSAWKLNDLKVIAVISGYNSKDVTDCVVENVAAVVPTDESTPVNTLKAADTVPQTIYSVDGRKISTAEKGINIVRMNDGTVKKVLVK